MRIIDLEKNLVFFSLNLQKVSMYKENKSAYFVAPLFAKKNLDSEFQLIAKTLKEEGYNVYDDVNKASADKAIQMSQTEITKYFTNVEKTIRNSDIFVAELTESSPSIGYEVGFAVANSKPVLILRKDGAHGVLGAPFRANEKRLITILSYDKENLKKQIHKFLKKAEKGIFVKRLPIEFTQSQIEYIEKIQKILNKKSFNATVRKIIDASEESNLI
jgi:nucleoside 2-deoxyribosyltransferase